MRCSGQLSRSLDLNQVVGHAIQHVAVASAAWRCCWMGRRCAPCLSWATASQRQPCRFPRPAGLPTPTHRCLRLTPHPYVAAAPPPPPLPPAPPPPPPCTVIEAQILSNRNCTGGNLTMLPVLGQCCARHEAVQRALHSCTPACWAFNGWCRATAPHCCHRPGVAAAAMLLWCTPAALEVQGPVRRALTAAVVGRGLGASRREASVMSCLWRRSPCPSPPSASTSASAVRSGWGSPQHAAAADGCGVAGAVRSPCLVYLARRLQHRWAQNFQV